MKVYLYYESNWKTDYTWLEVPDEKEFSVMIERDYQQRLEKAKPGEIIERRTPQEILNEEISKPTYRNYHRENRHCVSLEKLDPHDKLLGVDHPKTRRDSMHKSYDKATYPIKTLEEELLEDEYEDLHQALSALLPEQQELLKRIAIDEINQCQIAEEEGVSKSAISHRVDRIRERMIKLLKKDEKNFE